MSLSPGNLEKLLAVKLITLYSISSFFTVKEPKLTRHLATNIRITRPYVQRKPGRSPDEHEGELPLGILLTGGEKLRAEGLTGNGIKVAVIDSGVDDTHPGFHGKVVQQQWFRWGTPLSV
jgi:hypothetical protein